MKGVCGTLRPSIDEAGTSSGFWSGSKKVKEVETSRLGLGLLRVFRVCGLEVLEGLALGAGRLKSVSSGCGAGGGGGDEDAGGRGGEGDDRVMEREAMRLGFCASLLES